ncbi:MAG: cytochrome c-type biogenesis protein CcmH [Proteobacteria bacterium]|nr:cytochrome c-type biogenesis protein CcmH [Pseudomonadota bacterium]
MRRWLLTLACLLAMLMPATALAQAQQPDTPLVFRDGTEEARFHALTVSLRCVMCQNESLADSQAMIARDLRRQILELMRQGQSDAQIRQFLVARYGQFVLYQPRVEPATWALWFGPPLLLLGGCFALVMVVRKRAARARMQATANTATNADAAPPESSEDW